jgi:phosphotriesterase-related protein
MPAVPGSILVHEHVLIDFIGADRISPSRYSRDDAFRAAKPKLDALKPFGCKRLIECTPNFIGRDPLLLARLQDATGIELWTNTGLYGAANHKFLPAYAKDESPRQLAARWIAEWKGGVDGVKPRFMKIGVNIAPLHPWDRKLVEAAAITHLETGLPIASHTSGGGRAAFEQMAILSRYKVPLDRFIWVHAQIEKNTRFHHDAARAGAWVSFDGIGESSLDENLAMFKHMVGAGVLQRCLVSQDSGWYRVGEPAGGQFNGYTYLYETFLARVPVDFHQMLLVTNPHRAFGS